MFNECSKSAAEFTLPLPIKLEPLSITGEKIYEDELDDEHQNINNKIVVAEISDDSDFQNDVCSDVVDDDNDDSDECK